MNKEGKHNKKGRKPVEENKEKQEEYLKIYLLSNYYHYSHQEIQDELDISRSTVERAVNWINDNFIELPGKALLQGAIYATEKRIKKLTEQFEKELKQEDPSVRNIIELNREIRQDSKQLFELQEVYTEKHEVEVNTKTPDILKALSEKEEQT